eukprot:Lithocolla_globosa_v1_NODE_2418_length_2014_cov_12.115365.p2 type:complete len:109 gc:universal NODE_2418_length_2014_cov_12.115365:759-433(-)
MGALPQFLGLLVFWHPTIDTNRAQAQVFTNSRTLSVSLHSKLSGGGDDQHVGVVFPFRNPSLSRSDGRRDDKGERLTTSSSSDANHVSFRQYRRPGASLDDGGCFKLF